ncbi:DUF3037 domain-containing protein [Herbidospora yilanensis]|uniref:DUF3037 domain-containing protein n=1 Tax=Herbidospora yilanensis TaxID=354426 RepID=UPI000786419A|nr:DUF3037 domain-containing protein [Herbidospora yilanensis]
MSRYVYSIVRCLPDPRTGEFVNVAAVAGDPVAGDWSYRQLSNLERVQRFAGRAALEEVLGSLLDLDAQIDRHRESLLADHGQLIPDDWLDRLHHDHRNVMQFSPPAPILADSAEDALAVIFDHMLIDPVAPARQPSITRYQLQRTMRQAFHRAEIPEEFVRPRVQIYVGEKLHSAVDFAIANGRVVQLSQAWSFRLAQIDEVPLKVMAWGYALQRLRSGDEAKVVDAAGRVSEIGRDVDLQVMIAPPETSEQVAAFEEAQQVFKDVDAEVRLAAAADDLGSKAAELARTLHRF